MWRQILLSALGPAVFVWLWPVGLQSLFVERWSAQEPPDGELATVEHTPLQTTVVHADGPPSSAALGATKIGAVHAAPTAAGPPKIRRRRETWLVRPTWTLSVRSADLLA